MIRITIYQFAEEQTQPLRLRDVHKSQSGFDTLCEQFLPRSLAAQFIAKSQIR